MKEIEVKIVNHSNNPLPEYSTKDSAGMDVRAMLDEPVTRSGLALKKGITVLNTPGTIDADYRGEIKIILINLSSEPFTIENGERICQMVIKEYVKATLTQVDDLDDTERGAGGFGHTGVK